MHPKSLPHQCNITSPMTTKARIILATAKQTSQSPSLTNHVFPKAFKIITSLMPPPQHKHLYHCQTVCIVITTNQLAVTNTYKYHKTPQTPCIKVFYVHPTSLPHHYLYLTAKQYSRAEYWTVIERLSTTEMPSTFQAPYTCYSNVATSLTNNHTHWSTTTTSTNCTTDPSHTSSPILLP